MTGPTPGASAKCVIERWIDDHMEPQECIWQDHTAADVIANRTRRWRDAGTPFDRYGNTLIVTQQREEWVEKTVITVTDVTADGCEQPDLFEEGA